tara:strand:+ start:873 stop:1289 length:417 start_codon:yes stop_codon:yes gene_type:complete
MKDLAAFRNDLKTLNEEFFLFLEQRSSLVKSIQSTKVKTNNYFCFDPAHEFSLFSKQTDNLSKLSLKELYAYSLILEDHACVSEQSYPLWSEQNHLNEKNHNLSFGINPILLAVTYKDLYDQLPLNEEFKSSLEKHVK